MAEDYRPDIIGLGNCAVDLIGVFPRYPSLDERIQAISFQQQGGGEAATAMVTVSRLGARAAFIGKVGDDEFGRYSLRQLEKEGVDTSQIVVEKNSVSLISFIAVERSSGKRTIFWYRGVSPLRKTELNRRFIVSCSLLHLDHRHVEAGLAAATWARKARIPVTLDLDRLDQKLKVLVSRVIVVLGSRTLSQAVSDNRWQALRELKKMGPEVVVLTFGEEGCLVKSAEKEFFQPAFRVSVVDTTGAGDVFRGAFAFGWWKGWPLLRIVRFASAVAALKCKKLGGRAGIPTLKETLSFLAGHKK
ncbi:MAG TPA: PfkB family carbohydrate kinase [bacterium]|nr:PfkB family carbohydrate kinase [bacterium]HPP12393.1 PfkB family carbohydrate kinase [bacterium]